MTTAFSFTNDQIKLHWEEDYVTEGLNKQQTAESHGIVRGFDLAGQSPLSTDQFRLLMDTVKQDSVCCVRNSDDRVVTIIYDSDLTIDLSGLVASPGEYWICLYAAYSIGAITTASIEILTTAELSAAPYVGNIVVLGWVNYNGANIDPDPGGGTPNIGPSDLNSVGFLPGNNVAAMREIARNLESKGREPWSKAIRFGRVDEYLEAKSPLLGTPLYPADWRLINLINANVTAMMVDDTDPARGDLHFTVNLQDDGGGVPSAGFVHTCITPVRPGDIVRVSFRYKVPAGPIPGGWGLQFGYAAIDKAGQLVLVTQGSVLIADPAGAAMASYEECHHMFHIEDGVNIAAIVPIFTWFHNDGPGGAAWDVYLDEMDIEVQHHDSADNESNLILPADADKDLASTRSGPLQIGTFSGNAIPATQLLRKSWQLAMGDDDDLYLSRIVPTSTGGTTYPHAKMPGFGGIQFPVEIPVGGGNARRGTIYKDNIPRAHAKVDWNGVLYTLDISASFGFGGLTSTPSGPGTFQLEFVLDEDGNDWVNDDNYVVTFGTYEQYSFPGPYPVVMPVVYNKGKGAPGPAGRWFRVVLVDVITGVAADFAGPLGQVFCSVFKRRI